MTAIPERRVLPFQTSAIHHEFGFCPVLRLKPYNACNQLAGYNDLLSGRAELLMRQNHHDPRFAEGEKMRSHLVRLGLRLPLVNRYPATPHLHPAQPFELGWLNYWSAATCVYIGFPDPDRDQDLLALSYQTPGDAWLVKICPEPLDLDRDDHLKVFAELYQRFPKLGLREGAVEPPPPFEYPEHTVYIHEDDPAQLVERLVSLLREQGCRPAGSKREAGETAAVTVGLFRGSAEWTLIKTLPTGLLAKPSGGAEAPRLARLCRDTRRSGFSLNVYSEFEAELIEADADGRLFRSGIRSFAELPQDVDFHAMDESGTPPLLEFRWHQLDIETGAADFDDNGQIASQVHDLLAGRNGDLCADARFAAAINSQEFAERQGITLTFVRSAV